MLQNIKIGKVIVDGAHTGVAVSGNVQGLEIGSIEAKNIVGTVFVADGGATSQMRTLGLPPSLDAREVAALLERLLSLEESQRLQAATDCTIWSKVGSFALDISTAAANLVTVAGSTDVRQVISNLLS